MANKPINPQAEVQTLRDAVLQLEDLRGCILQLIGHEDIKVSGMASVMYSHLDNALDKLEGAGDRLEVFTEHVVKVKES